MSAKVVLCLLVVLSLTACSSSQPAVVVAESQTIRTFVLADNFEIIRYDDGDSATFVIRIQGGYPTMLTVPSSVNYLEKALASSLWSVVKLYSSGSSLTKVTVIEGDGGERVIWQQS